MAVSTIRSRIKAVRKTLNISQRVFSQSIFLSHTFYANIETGRRNPNERVYELICNKYNINKDWLITGKGDMFSASPPDIELEQLVKMIQELDPLFREYIVQQIKLFANLHRNSKDQKPSKSKKTT